MAAHKGLIKELDVVQKWRELGYTSLEDFLVGFWEGFFLERDPNNLLTMLSTWANGNIGKTPGFDGSLEKALACIKARLCNIRLFYIVLL